MNEIILDSLSLYYTNGYFSGTNQSLCNDETLLEPVLILLSLVF